MYLAVDTIKNDQGGLVIVNKGKIISKVQLPIAGLLSDKKASVIAKENAIFKQSWIDAGCTLAYMGFNLLPLSVIPNLRITNKGLVDVNKMKLISLIKEMKNKEFELLPLLQNVDGLTSDVKLLIEKLKQMDKDIKELKQDILEI